MCPGVVVELGIGGVIAEAKAGEIPFCLGKLRRLASRLVCPQSTTAFTGREADTSLAFALAFLMVWSGLAPYRATTTPPAASAPLTSMAPRRAAGPSWTVATWATVIGVLSRTVTTASSRSLRFLIYPVPRRMYSTPLMERFRAPVSILDLRTASATWARVTFHA